MKDFWVLTFPNDARSQNPRAYRGSQPVDMVGLHLIANRRFLISYLPLQDAKEKERITAPGDHRCFVPRPGFNLF
jgi:hypothetical protein